MKHARHLAAACILALAGTLPARALGAEDWSAWPHRLQIKLDYRDTCGQGMLPIDAVFSIKASEMKDPKREIRLIYESRGQAREVPFQLSRLTLWTQDADGQTAVPTHSGRITFFDVSDGDPAGMYCVLYGNPNAPAPTYATDLKWSGKFPALVIENSKIKVELRAADEKRDTNLHDYFGDSGQIAQVTVKSRPEAPITNSRRSVHWNPDVFTPLRGWLHSYAWDPPQTVEIEQGPIFVELRRSGPFPHYDEIDMGMTYRFYAGRNFVFSGSRLDFKKTVGITVLRNDELVFDQPIFTHLAWKTDDGRLVHNRVANYKPVNANGDILRLKAGTPFIAAYNPETKIGAASVRLAVANVGPFGDLPTLFDNATYVATGSTRETFLFWSHPQVYFQRGWDRTQQIPVPAGSVYAERNCYCFYDTDEAGRYDLPAKLSHAVLHQPEILVGPHPFPPSR